MVIRDCPTLMMRSRSYLIWSISPFAPPTIPSFPRPPWRQLRSREIRYIYIVPVSRLEGRTRRTVKGRAREGASKVKGRERPRARASRRAVVRSPQEEFLQWPSIQQVARWMEERRKI